MLNSSPKFKIKSTNMTNLEDCYYNLTRKAAYSFLASITTREDEGNNTSKNANDSPTLSTKSYNDTLSPDPPDPKYDQDIELEKAHTIEIGSIRNNNKGSKKNQRVLAATNFLSSLSFGFDNIPQTNSAGNSLSERAETPPIPITAPSTYERDFEHAGSVTRKSLADSCYSGHHTLSSSPTDLDSDEEPPDISRKQSPENQVGSYFSRRESYLNDKVTSPTANANQSNQPIFALEFSENPQSSNNEINPNRRPRLKNQSQTSRTDSRKKDSQKKIAPSYAYLLEPSYSLTNNPTSSYNPYTLDDPALEADETSVLASFMESLIHYGKTKDSKKEIEEVFQVSHPTVDNSLTLGNIRSLKHKILTTAVNLDLELSSVALAYAYFEKLALKGYINKDNRRITAASCLFLAVKVNEHKNRLGDLIESLERTFDVDDKDIYSNEFEIFSYLDFNLFLPLSEFMPHMDRIFSELGYKNGNEYLGEVPFYSFDPPE